MSKKILIGMMSIVMLVGLNFQHTLNNYGLSGNGLFTSIKAKAKNSEKAFLCDTKPDGSIVYQNFETHSQQYVISCCYLIVTKYYKMDEKGNEHFLGTKTVNLESNTTTISPHDADLSSYTRIEEKKTTKQYSTFRYWCDGHQENNCCYPKEAEANCSNLVQGRT